MRLAHVYARHNATACNVVLMAAVVHAAPVPLGKLVLQGNVSLARQTVMAKFVDLTAVGALAVYVLLGRSVLQGNAAHQIVVAKTAEMMVVGIRMVAALVLPVMSAP